MFKSKKSYPNAKWYLFIIMFLGFYIRFLGIDFSLPFSSNPIETTIVDKAMLYDFRMQYHDFFTGIPILSYILFFEFGLFFIIGKILGFFATLKDFQVFYLMNPYHFYFLGRVTTGFFFGMTSVYLVYLFAKMITRNDETIALLSALFLSFCYTHVRESHFISPDVFFVFLVLLALVYLVRLQQNVQPKYFLLVAILIGITSSVKLSGFILLIPLLIGVLFLSRSENIKPRKIVLGLEIILTLVASFFIFWSINPSVFVYIVQFSHRLLTLPCGLSLKLFSSIVYSLSSSVGVPIVIASVLGIIISIARFRKYNIAITFTLCYCILVALLFKHRQSYFLGVIPCISFFASLAIVTISRYIFRKFVVLRSICIMFLSLVLVAPLIIKSSYLDYLLLCKNTVNISRDWILENIPSETSMAIDVSTGSYPRLFQTKLILHEKLVYMSTLDKNIEEGVKENQTQLLFDSKEYAKSKTYQIYYSCFNSSVGSFYPMITLDMENLKKYDIEYIVLSAMLKTKAKDEILDACDLKFEVDPVKKRIAAFDNFFSDLNRLFLNDDNIFSKYRFGDKISIYCVRKTK